MNSYNLHKAKQEKNDEFYTQYKDVEKECQHYVEHFKDQCIYLPCDSEQSNFYKYFVEHFNEYGLKRLTATHINLDGTPSYRLDYDGSEVIKTLLKGNGDFRSEECTKIKDECDIVITNPPFSLFRDFIKWLQLKKFLIIGNINAIACKEIFPLIKDNKIWAGYKPLAGGMNMIQNKENFDQTKTKSFYINEKGEIIKTIMGCIWFTNLPNEKHNTPITLTQKYNANEYPKYDNYNAINVNKVSDIPMDYEGVMGVPITFWDKYCPEQFDIIGMFKGFKESDIDNGLICGTLSEYIDKNGVRRICKGPVVNKKSKYNRLIIKKKIDK